MSDIYKQHDANTRRLMISDIRENPIAHDNARKNNVDAITKILKNERAGAYPSNIFHAMQHPDCDYYFTEFAKIFVKRFIWLHEARVRTMRDAWARRLHRLRVYDIGDKLMYALSTACANERYAEWLFKQKIFAEDYYNKYYAIYDALKYFHNKKMLTPAIGYAVIYTLYYGADADKKATRFACMYDIDSKRGYNRAKKIIQEAYFL